MKNIFADKASLILRKMLSTPEKKWVIRDFTGKDGVSIGLTQGVIEAMQKKGYIEREKQGPQSYSLLTNPQQLIQQWTGFYTLDKNEIYTYYSAEKNILYKLKDYLKNKPYALTCHSGANLMTSYVITDQVFLYFNPDNWGEKLFELRQQLDLKELVRGGNVHIIRPYYKNSIFYNIQKIRGYKSVSNLQLYLDLFHYKPRGKEHAEYLKRNLDKAGRKFYES